MRAYFSCKGFSCQINVKIFCSNPMHKMRKPHDSPAAFRPNSLTSCVLKLIQRNIIPRLLFFLESNSILSPRQTVLRHEWSTLYQIIHLDEFNKPTPSSPTILATMNFSEAVDSVWHPGLFCKCILVRFPPCLVFWTQSVLSATRACQVFQNHKGRSF